MIHQGQRSSDSLIFIISQPRAGSTLLQRILGSHPDVHTVSEPWLMLHPLYALRDKGYEAEYGASLAQKALRNFLQDLPEGEEAYLEGIRRMYGHLYRRILEESGKRYFLDKTPRYYYIITELYRTFPKAYYIILFRNPLAILCSILKNWVNEDWLRLYKFGDDLMLAPRLLLKGKKITGEQSVFVHYERLIKEPKNELQHVCDWLGLDFIPEMINYGRKNKVHWQFGDQKTVYQYKRPVSENVDKWMEALNDAQYWRLENDYLRLLGSQIIEQMGYSYDELQLILQKRRPNPVRKCFTFSLSWLINEDCSSWKRELVRLMGSLRRRGIRGTTFALFRKFNHALSNFR